MPKNVYNNVCLPVCLSAFASKVHRMQFPIRVNLYAKEATSKVTLCPHIVWSFLDIWWVRMNFYYLLRCKTRNRFHGALLSLTLGLSLIKTLGKGRWLSYFHLTNWLRRCLLIMHWWDRSSSRGPNNIIDTTQQKYPYMGCRILSVEPINAWPWCWYNFIQKPW